MNEVAPVSVVARELRAFREELAAIGVKPPVRCKICKGELIFMEGWNSKRWFALHPRIACRLRMATWGYADTEEELRAGIKAGQFRREASEEVKQLVGRHLGLMVLRLLITERQKEARETVKTQGLFALAVENASEVAP